ncbi:MAG TPA: hypothetical protein VF681_05985 [Abditibacteriaceae bacterium]|jgi:hypothetical protein
MKKFLLPAIVALGATGAFSSNAMAQDAKPLSVSTVPSRADAPVLFAPSGWRIEQQINGHLNRDKVWDAALVLVENPKADEEAPRQRALVVVLREGKGLRRVGFNNSLLLGTRDGGAFYGASQTPVNIAIRKGVLHVNQENGSREVLDTTHKFRFDGQSRMMLIGADSIQRDRGNGSARIVSINYSTGVRHDTKLAMNSETTMRMTSRVSRKLRPLEAVKVDERYAE